MDSELDKELAELDDVLNIEMESVDGESDETETETETKTETKTDKTSEETSDEKKKTEETDKTPEKNVESTDGDEKNDENTDKRYNQLLDQINVLQGQLKDKPPEDKKEVVDELIDYMKDTSLDDLDVNILNKIFNQISKNAQEQLQATYAKQIPGIVGSQIDNKLSSQDIVNQFYSANKDLKNVRNVVKACASQISQEHKDWTIDQILKDAALKTRESLGMPEYKEEELPSSNKAAFAKGSSGKRTKTEKISALQQEIDEL